MSEDSRVRLATWELLSSQVARSRICVTLEEHPVRIRPDPASRAVCLCSRVCVCHIESQAAATSLSQIAISTPGIEIMDLYTQL